MARSRRFVAVSLVTAASLAVSSIASARPIVPVVSADAVRNPSTLKVDDGRERQERKRVQWERHYRDRDDRSRDDRGRDERGRDERGRGAPPPPKPTYRGHERSAPPPPQTRHAAPRHAAPPPPQPRHAAPRYVAPPPPRKVIVVRPVPPGPRVVIPPHRRYHYRDVWIVRPYGHWYSGYGYHYHDHDAYPWLAFTAITLSLLALLTVAQQRAQEQAQIDAATAPVGSTIVWNDANASGSVSVLRDGHSTDGQYCREFLQTVTVGGRSEQAYGTACRQPDGSWRIVQTR